MKVAFPTSVPTIPKVDSTSVFVGFDALLDGDYLNALREKRNNGAFIIHVGGHNKDLNSSVVIKWKLSTLENTPKGNGVQKYGLLIYPETSDRSDWSDLYTEAANSPNVSVIVIAASNTDIHDTSVDGLTRVKFIHRLVKEKKFCTRKSHWLYGVPNPAELSAYPLLFSNFISGKIKLAICSTCFLYSIFGIRFSEDVGVLHRMSEVKDTRSRDLGLIPWDDYAMSKEQLRCFYLNMETVQGFAEGRVGFTYMDRVGDMLEEVS